MLSTNELVAQVISFLILLFLLRIFAWKKMLGFLDQRPMKKIGSHHDLQPVIEVGVFLKMGIRIKFLDVLMFLFLLDFGRVGAWF